MRGRLGQIVQGAVDAQVPHVVEVRSQVAAVRTRLNRPLSLGASFTDKLSGPTSASTMAG